MDPIILSLSIPNSLPNKILDHQESLCKSLSIPPSNMVLHYQPNIIAMAKISCLISPSLKLLVALISSPHQPQPSSNPLVLSILLSIYYYEHHFSKQINNTIFLTVIDSFVLFIAN